MFSFHLKWNLGVVFLVCTLGRFFITKENTSPASSPAAACIENPNLVRHSRAAPAQLLLSFLGKHLACLLIPNIPLTALRSLGFSPLLLRLAGDYSILKHNAPLSEEVLSQFSVCSSKLMVSAQELHQEKLSMCGVPEESNTKPRASNEVSSSGMAGKERPLDGDPDDNSFWLLELAANNDLDKFRQGVEEGKANVDAVGSWYSRHNGTSKMVLEQRTPAMIAALYGSLDVLRYIVNSYGTSGGDVDRTCGSDGITALHCAAAGGSVCAVETVTLLLDFGANLNALDAQGRRPADVIRVSPLAAHTRAELEELLKGMKLTQVMPDHVPADPESGVSSLDGSVEDGCLPATFDCASLFYDVHMGEAAADGGVVEPSTIPFSPSVTAVLLGASGLSPSPTSSPKSLDTGASKVFGDGAEKTREYLVDPSVPDIKNSIYMTDEFRMFSFKIRPCSRAYSHDWTECPFVHPGENARRRDPRRYHYSCVPCPDFRKGACRRGDACEYAHGVFESWLHPAQYRTRLCKDGTGCTRRVCFFAHTTEELRPLYVSTGSAVPSLRTTAPLDMMSMSPPLTPGSPSSFSAMSPFSLSNSAQDHTQGGVATPPMSPSSSSANSLGWPQPNLPALKLPGVGLHGSRLRAALNARDISLDGLTRPSDFDGQLMSEFASLSSQALSTQARMNAAVVASACGTTSSRAGKYRSLGLSVAPTNLEELFASEMVSSPRSVVHDAALLSQMEAQMHSQKSARLQSQLHSQLQSQLSSQVFPQVSAQMQLQLQQAALDSQLQGSPLSQSPVQSPAFSLGSLGHMATLRGMDVDRQGISGTPLSPAGVAARLAFAQRDKRSHSSRDLGAALATDWGSPTGKPEWGVQGDDLSKFRKSASFGVRESEEPDLTWVQRLVKEGPLEADAASATTPCSGNGAGSGQREGADDASVLGSWIDKMHLDQIVA